MTLLLITLWSSLDKSPLHILFSICPYCGSSLKRCSLLRMITTLMLWAVFKGLTELSFWTGRILTELVLRRQWKNFFRVGRSMQSEMLDLLILAREALIGAWVDFCVVGRGEEEGGSILMPRLSVAWISEISSAMTLIESSTVTHLAPDGWWGGAAPIWSTAMAVTPSWDGWSSVSAGVIVESR